MRVEQSFTVARPIGEVWMLFKDAKRVAACMPGAELTAETAPGTYNGRVALRLGPFSASFEGEAQVRYDEAARSGHVEGKGVDKRGGSRSRMVLDFALTAPEPGATTVQADADVTLSGAIAQFGRTGLIQETANILIGQFARNLEAHLAPASSAPTASEAPGTTDAPSLQDRRELGGVSLILRALAAWMRRLLGRSTVP